MGKVRWKAGMRPLGGGWKGGVVREGTEYNETQGATEAESRARDAEEGETEGTAGELRERVT